MDLTKILKVGDEIYSPMLGNVIVVDIKSTLITVDKNSFRYNFQSDGRYLPSGEVMLKASEKNNFVDYQFKRGDYVVSKRGNTFIVSGKNRIYVGAAVAISSSGICKEVDDWAAVERYATDHECYLFDQELAKLGYKWDGDELVPLEEWINLYKDPDGLIHCATVSYPSKEEALQKRGKTNYYTTVRIR